ncbi:MAG: hypothetical protein ACOY46_10615 [Bacillota bacterium]
MKSEDILYDLLKDKIMNQKFYNDIMVNMVNPLARDLFKAFRDDEEREVIKIRKQFLTLEAKPMIFKSFVKGKI